MRRVSAGLGRAVRTVVRTGAVVSLGGGLLGSCAGLDSDVHLAPLYTQLSTADGGTLVEAAGGLYRQHRRDEGEFLQWQTLAPLWGIVRERDGDWTAEHPFLLGRTRVTDGEATSYVVPLYLGWSRTNTEGVKSSFLATITGLFRRQKGDDTRWGWFPFYGSVGDLLTFDEASFVLWPLYVHNERDGRVSNHVLWPIFGWTTGAGESSWHVFPLVGRASWEDRYDRTYVLWPIFHWQRNFLGGGGEEPELAWMVYPFLGHKRRGTYRSWTTLWPLFGYSYDTRSGFWALDFPFFLVRIQRGPGDEVKRTRFWPFWSHLEAPGLEQTSWLWPLVTKRSEDAPTFEREAFSIVPFWQSWDRRDKGTGERARWRKAWPLFRHEVREDWRAGALLDLDPFFRNDLVPRHLTGFFHLWDWEVTPDYRRDRSLLGLWRREKGRGEDRRSLSGLWARRDFEHAGRPAHETSLLFGLLRWRVTADGGFDMLPPAFPGPGWPPHEHEAVPLDSRSYF